MIRRAERSMDTALTGQSHVINYSLQGWAVIGHFSGLTSLFNVIRMSSHPTHHIQVKVMSTWQCADRNIVFNGLLQWNCQHCLLILLNSSHWFQGTQVLKFDTLLKLSSNFLSLCTALLHCTQLQLFTIIIRDIVYRTINIKKLIYAILRVLRFDSDWAIKKLLQRSFIAIDNEDDNNGIKRKKERFQIPITELTFKFIFVLQSSPSFDISHIRIL